jgi:hypothetical protein
LIYTSSTGFSRVKGSLGGDHFPAWTSDEASLVALRIPVGVGFHRKEQVGAAVRIDLATGARAPLTPALLPDEGFYQGGFVTRDDRWFVGAGRFGGSNGLFAVPLHGPPMVSRLCDSAGTAPVWAGGAVYD